ncbi:MAG: hypothetical protein Q8L29_04180 [archaeon]|nr:hypothetical protein [archaeon]
MKMVETKIDPYKHKERFLRWKEQSAEGIKGLSPQNGLILKSYLSDMENGLNVASLMKKGPRSYTRLYTLKIRIAFLMKMFEQRLNLDDLTKVDEQQLHNLFTELRTGVIKKHDGNLYQSAKDYARDFKAFWHWHQKVNKKKGIGIEDITMDLDTTGEKPKWVYLTENQVKLLADRAKYEYKVLIWFLFDTGIRAPTELMNIRVADLQNDCKELNIRQEISKTFGRRIKLMLCSGLIKDYIREKGLQAQDYLFKICPPVTNRYLKRLAKRILGDGESLARENYSQLTMYDFRHCASCYWLPRYKSESALKYRFGWKKSDKIHYYSELLGMKDTINEDDMLIDVTKGEMEKRLERSEKEKEIMQEQMNVMQIQFVEVGKLLEQIKAQGVIL